MSTCDEMDTRKRLNEPDLDLGVSAGAGTGKTWSLVDRYVNILRHGVKNGIGSSNMLALTFTEKAATEMKDRVREAVLKDGSDLSPTIIEELNWANISTIHSFCAELVRRYAIECEVAPDFQILDDNARATLVDEALERTLLGLSGDVSEDSAVRLMTLGDHVDKKFLSHSLKFIYDKRNEIEEWMKTIGHVDDLKQMFESVSNDRTRKYLRYQKLFFDRSFSKYIIIMANALDSAISAEEGSHLNELKMMKNEVKRILSSSIDQMGTYGESAVILRTSLVGNSLREVISQGKCDESVERAYTSARNDLLKRMDLAIETDNEAFEKSARTLIDLWTVYLRFEVTLEGMKAEKGVLDFDDLIDKAYQFLNDDRYENVRRSLSKRYRYIFVDELQDTDHLQTGILERLLCDWPDGKLFVVGDRKQSIFRFRNAEVEQFDRLLDLIKKEKKNDREELVVNHRSTREVIDFVNRSFRSLIASKGTEYQDMVLYDARKDDRGSVDLTVVTPDELSNGKKGTVEEQSSKMAEKIDKLLKDPTKLVYLNAEGKHSSVGRTTRPGDVAILLRTMTNVQKVERALRAKGIKYQVYKGKGFFDRQEVRDILCLLRFLKDPADDIALVGVLRSPLVSMTDEEVYRISMSKGWSIWSKMRQLAQENKSVHDHITRLNGWLDVGGRSKVSDVLHEILVESGAVPVYAGLDDGDQAIANIHKAIKTIRDMESLGLGSLSEIVQRMEGSFDKMDKEGQAALDLEEGDSVKIMTIHAAKGLEFPVVVIPFMEWVWNGNHLRRGEGVDIDFDPAIGLGLSRPSTNVKRVPDNVFSAVQAAEDIKDQAEHVRTFYVAATRARDHLMMIGERDVRYFGEPTSWMSMLTSTYPEIVDGKTTVETEKGSTMTVETLSTTDIAPATGTTGITLRGLDEIGERAPWKGIDAKEKEPPLNATSLLQGRTSVEKRRDGYIKALKKRLEPLGGDPMERGTVVHEVLRGRDIEMVLSEHDVKETREHLETIRQRFLASDLMKNGIVDLRELPFSSIIEGHRFNGFIDRLVLTKDGSWTVVDYKIDAATAGGDSDVLKKHGIQLQIYTSAVEKALGQRVSGTVYLTREDRFVPFGDVGKEELKARLREWDEEHKT